MENINSKTKKTSGTQAKDSRFRQIHLFYLPKIGRIKKPAKTSSGLKFRVNLQAMTFCCSMEQWFSMDRTTGYSEVANAYLANTKVLSLIAIVLFFKIHGDLDRELINLFICSIVSVGSNSSQKKFNLCFLLRKR